ncbi:hypothetical protein [Actinomyces howellii]|nr:hypothetical protein [Actinomyces howellii]
MASILLAAVGMIYGAILGPALSWLFSPTLGGATLEDMRTAVPRRRSRRKSAGVSSSRRSTSDESDSMLAVVILAVAVTAAYIKWRAWLLLGISLISVSTGLAASAVAIVAWWKSVIAGTKAVVACMLTPLILSGAGFVLVSFLWRAPAAPAEIRKTLAACSIDGIDLHTIAYVTYSIVGAAFYALASVASIIWSLAAVSTIYAAKGVAPRFAWRYLAERLTLPLGWRWPALLIVSTGIGMLFASGLVYSWWESMSAWEVP